MIMGAAKWQRERGHGSAHKSFLVNALQRHAGRQIDHASVFRQKTFGLDVKFPGLAQLS